jgi:hypothetical protein
VPGGKAIVGVANVDLTGFTGLIVGATVRGDAGTTIHPTMQAVIAFVVMAML